MGYESKYYYSALEAIRDKGDDESRADAVAILIQSLVDYEAKIASDTAKTLDSVYALVGSATIRLESWKAFDHLQRHASDALRNNNRAPMLFMFVADALADLQRAQALDDRIPF